MFKALQSINRRPQPFDIYTTPLLWNDRHLSKKMLDLHLDEHIDLASRKKTFVDRSSDWIISRFDIGPDKTLCDYGCGPGLYTLRFASTGADVTGIDLSRRSIDYAKNCARDAGLDIHYILKNYMDFSSEKPFDLITMIYCDYCVLSPAQRKVLLKNINAHLKPGASLLLDVFSLNYFDTVLEQHLYEYSAEDGFWSANPSFVFSNTYKYDDEKLYLDKYTIVEQDRTWEIFNWMQCFSLQSIEKELKDSGFIITETYADVSGTPYSPTSHEIAVVAQKNL